MGGGSKTETTNQNQQATTTPQTPTYALDPVKNYFSGISNYQAADPYSFVTPANSLQTAAYTNAAGGLFGSNALYGQAANGAQGVLGATPTTAQASQTQAQTGTLGAPAQAQSASLLDNFNSYLNPATDTLVNTSLADYDQNSGQVRAQQAAEAAKNGAFGGSRYGVQQGVTEGELARGRASTDANLRFNAYNTAAGLAQSDAANRQATNLFNTNAQNTNQLTQFGADNTANMFNAGQANTTSQFNAGQQNDMQNQQLARQLQASGLLGDLGTAYGSNYRADLGTQADLGNQLYQMQSAANNAPLTQLQNVGNLLNPGYLSAVSGQTVTGSSSGVDQTKTSGGLLNSLLSLGGTLGGAAIMKSDRRVKRDIVRLGEDPDGLGGYRFNYLWDEADAPPRYGVMADEIAKLRPWALGPVVDGAQTVNYLAALETR